MEKVDLDKIINEMSNKHTMCFTELERTLLESAVLHGALFNNKENAKVMKELNDKLLELSKTMERMGLEIAEYKKTWFDKLIG